MQHFSPLVATTQHEHRRILHPVMCFLFACITLAWTSPFVCAQDVKEQTKLNLLIEASSGVNPNTSERASPIKVRIYELKDSASFSEADYFSLDSTDKATLAADLLAKDEFILRPGENKRIERKSNPQTTAIGVLAGYRDLPNATWRAVQPLKPAPEASWMRFAFPAPKLELTVQLQPQGIVLIKAP
jgi:type VI secretion system protein VasD